MSEQGIIGSKGIDGQQPKFYDKHVWSKGERNRYEAATNRPDQNNPGLPDESGETISDPYRCPVRPSEPRYGL